jgi:hypothetical protein
MATDSVFVDHTTVSAKVTGELYGAAAKAGISFVDAPISGGQAGAENAALSIMCGGTRPRSTAHCQFWQSIPKFAVASVKQVQAKWPRCAIRLQSQVWFKGFQRRCILHKKQALMAVRSLN